jgi:hypothetical protein
MQADFAARVAKSVGVPAVYCRAPSATRNLSHAWWTYVQVQKATAKELLFTLRSDGQFVGFLKDAFYVGQVLDPHTGRLMLDTDMHRRLTLAGRDRVAWRQVSLLMRHYPVLAQKLQWSTKDRLAFIDKCIALCPQSDEPWMALTPLVKDKLLDAEDLKAHRTRMGSVAKHFQNYPDFVSRAFFNLSDALDSATQLKLDQQAVALCEKSNRPDLACDMRLQINDVLVKDKKWQTAAEGLIATIYRFPTEGRFVPTLAKKLQEAAPNYKGGNERLARVYLDIVPKLYAYYKGEPGANQHKILYAQAKSFFDGNQMTAYAAQLKAMTGQ